jgi:uncharacterized protein (DUF3820 family)
MAAIESTLTDESLMPYGQHKGKKMANVPAKDLIWLYDNNKCTQPVKDYIEDNMDVLIIEIKRSNNEKKL